LADISSEAQLEDFPHRFFVKGVVSINIQLADWTTRLDSPGVVLPTWTIKRGNRTLGSQISLTTTYQALR
jgi:hypothetical protein